MKFQHSLQFNAVPEWVSKYLDYARLKKTIYQIEKSILTEEAAGDNERQALISTNGDEVFERAIREELEKVNNFYVETEPKIYEDLDVLLADEADYQKRHIPGAEADIEEQRRNETLSSFFLRHRISVTSEDDGDDVGQSHQQHPQEPLQRRRSSASEMMRLWDDMPKMTDYMITLKQRAISVYVSLCELRSFINLNQTGFRKAIKKYRKISGSSMSEASLKLNEAYIFSHSTEEALEDRIDEVTGVFARAATDGDMHLATQQLRLNLREHVVWERNTVWRDMIGMERRAYAANASETVVGDKGAEKGPDYVKLGSFVLPTRLFSMQSLKVLLILFIFIALLAFPLLDSVEQSNCLAVVVFASLMWATEAMPLFVTSLTVPMLVVLLRIPIDEASGSRMTAEAASKFIFSQMWSSVIMLLLGGFTLAAALSKYHIAKRLATAIMSRSGTNPKIILLNLMIVAAFLSMWISNVASPVLCYSLAQPLLRTLPNGSPFAKAIVFGIALASNVGGMISPIASPQNIIALENMSPEPSWGQWFLVAIPVSVVALLVIWILLILTFRSREAVVLGHVRELQDKFTFDQYFIIFVTAVTIVLWIFSHQLEGVFGEMGVSALIPIIAFFGTGLLTSEDFNNFLWTIIALAMGGIALGKAVSSSGLLFTIAHAIELKVEGLQLYHILLVFGFLVLVVATFVSHTVAALILLPLVASVGKDLEDPQPNLLVMASALLCSCAMGLPTSGFPNVTAICMTDELGKPYLTVSTFISRGVLASLLVFGVVVSVGYVMMKMAAI